MSVFCNVISLRFEELALAVSDGTTLDHEVQVFEAWKSNWAITSHHLEELENLIYSTH